MSMEFVGVILAIQSVCLAVQSFIVMRLLKQLAEMSLARWEIVNVRTSDSGASEEMTSMPFRQRSSGRSNRGLN